MMASNPLTSLTEKIKKSGVRVEKKDLTLTLRIEPKKLDSEKLRPFLFPLLNHYEKGLFITIVGLPPCLLPEAEDHIIYERRKKERYSKKLCLRCRFYRTCPGWPQSLARKKIKPHPVPDLPLEIVIEVTQKCNQGCLLCFTQAKNNILPLSQIKTIIDESKRRGIKILRFTGGEPLLHPKIAQALQYAKGRGLYVILNTNATVFDNEIKKTIKGCVDNILISLQGFSPSSEKRLTKSTGSFAKKIKNIITLNRMIPTVRIGTIISRTLLENLSKYKGLMQTMGIRHWELYRPMACGFDKEFGIKRADFLRIMLFLKKIKKGGLDVKIANPLPFCIAPDLKLSRTVLLGARADDGHSRLVFDARGFFKPSYFLCQNLGKNLEEAWHHPFAKKLRSLNYLPKRCQQCSDLKWCKGGSRFLAYLYSGNCFKPDPLMETENKRS